MNKLIIFWNQKASDYFNWYLTENTEQDAVIPELATQQILKADLSAIADSAEGKQVTLVVSCQDVHFNQVKLPSKAQRHLRKAVPFLLEEQLAEPVDQVFVAIGDISKEGQIPVRAINTQYLQSILTAFENAEIKLDSIVTDLDLVMRPEEGGRVVLNDSIALVNDQLTGKWYAESDLYAWLSQKKINEVETEDDLPVAIPLEIISDNEEKTATFTQTLPAGRFAPQTQIVESVNVYLADSLAGKPSVKPINLLQAEFAPKVERSPLQSLVVKLGGIAASLFVVFLIFQASTLALLAKEQSALEMQREALWKKAFPNRKVASSPDRVLRSTLKSLGGGNRSDGFLSILNSVAQDLPDAANLYPTNISFNAARNELRMDIVAKDLSVLNAYRDKLRASGHEVDMSSASQRGEGYSSRLIIRR